MSSQKSINGISKFLLSTLVAAAAMTSTAWAEGTTETTLTVESGCTHTVSASDKNYTTITNSGTISVDKSTLTAGTITNSGASATFTMADSTLMVDELDNDVAMFVSGVSTIQVQDATGSSYAIRVNDGTTLVDSYVKAKDNSTLRMLGSMTVKGGLTVAYLEGAQTGKSGIGGTLTLADGCTVNASYGVEFSNDYTLKGGKIVLSGGNASGEMWGFVFQSGTYNIDTDIEVIGNNGTYAPIHFTNATATISSDISQTNSGGEPIYLSNSTVTLKNGASLSSGVGIHVNANSNLIVESGATITGTITVNEGAKLTLAASSLLENITLGTIAGEVVVQTVDTAVKTKSLTVETVDGNAVTLSANAAVTVNKTVDVTGSVKIAGAGTILSAWSFDVENASSENMVTVTMEVGEGLDLGTINVYRKGDEEGATWELTDIVATYDKDAGTVTFSTSGFSTYALAQAPEPSAFGLLAGLGALALVASRRRRK